jgi:hypothetical protein
MAGYKAFRQSYLGVDLLSDEQFTDFEARKARYAILFAMYENTAYSRMHTWAHLYKVDYGLYRYTRNIFNPAYRIGEFWKIHLLGGKLDPNAGDGVETPSALPIVTENEAIREQLSWVWEWSNWQVNKDIAGLWTPVMGDGVIKIIDDPEREKVYMKNIHPGTLKDVELDEFGNVKGYTIEEYVFDPQKGRAAPKVKYTEICTRDGDNVVYQTLKNDRPFAWDADQGEEWEIPYGFVPMVVYQHNNVGLDFGWSELMPGMSQFREVDDLASKLSDQIRKAVNPRWLYSGVQNPANNPQAKAAGQTTPKTSSSTPTSDNPQPGREQEPALYGPAGSDAKPLIADINIADTSTYIKEILSDIERNYPELNADMHNVEGEISGRALRINRAPAENKVLQRRPNYDNAIVRAQQMALSIGGYRGYFSGIDLDSFANGDLDHQIGDRPVFGKDVMDDLEYDKELYTVAKEAKAVGIPLVVFLKQKGWTDEQIADVTNSPEYKAHVATLEATVEASKNPEAPATDRFGGATNA